ncbi:MAG: GntR family transcriptional regulator [Acetivibrionales bacterium]|nr:GntR family transcriptional regulator [Bacillota bacterium]NLP07827.1 GntR family transcriptional regulator [Clostridiaceae bacterium]HOA56106.1 GntR family transcriptional regulator [Clostridiales bacterium]HPZ06136.1 GntR family transcriptional regulator [Clostridiales bacterium]HQD32071.1 GntR family transcriptional regulator [Clostridiales bacterium]
MKLDFSNEKPIYLQIAESIEDDIIRGVIEEETQIPSTNQMAVIYKINPATAGKGINLLVDRGILYKRRGIGMFVAGGARKKILEERKSSFYSNYIVTLLDEARNLGIGIEELIDMIRKGDRSDE